MRTDDEQSSGGPAAAGGLRKPTPSRPQLPSMLPVGTGSMSSFLAEQESDDSASFSSLLAGAINADKKQPDGETDDRGPSSSEVRDTMSKCLPTGGPGPIKPTTARFKSMPPSRIPIPKAPCVTIPPGLSPTTLLDSPVLLSSHQAEPSPTTGTFPLPPLLGEAGTKSSDGSKEKTPDQNTFLFKPFPKPGSRSLSPLGGMASVPFSFPQPVQERLQLQAQPLVTPEAVPTSSFALTTSSPPAEQEQQLTVKADKSPEQSQSSAMGENDGYNWRKYGQKLVKGSENPRSYYKCTYVNCPMKKKVERSPDGQVTEIVYEGEQHNHPKPQPTRRTAMMSGAPRNQIAATDGSDAFRNQSNGAAGEQSSSSTSDDEGNEDEPDGKRRKKEKQLKESPVPRTVREPRVVVQTTSEVDVLDDGYRWRKYGQKVVKGNPHPRSYYKCTNLGCPVRKHVERACDDPKAVITTYEGKHNHDVPAVNPRGGAHDRIAAAAMEIVPSQRSEAISFPTPATSLDQQVSRPSAAAINNVRISFGKYKGEELRSLSNGYLSSVASLGSSKWSKLASDILDERAPAEECSSSSSPSCSQDGVDYLVRLLKLCSRNNDLAQGRRLHDLIKSRYHENKFLKDQLVHMYGRCNKVVEAVAVFDSIKDPTTISRNIMISAYVHNDCLAEAKAMFDGASRRDTVTWNILTTAYTQRGHLEEVKDMFERIPCLDLVTCNSMVAAYAQRGFLDESTELFETMPGRDVVSWNSIITAHAKSGHLAAAQEYFNRMSQWSEVSWNTLIAALAQQSWIQEAKSLFDKMPSQNVIIWTAILHGYAQAGDIQQARDLFHRMPQHDVVTCTAVITTYAQAGYVGEAKQVFEAMPEKDAMTWNVMMALYSQAGLLVEAEEAFDRVDKKNVGSWNGLLQAYSLNSSLDDVTLTFSRMPQHNRVSKNCLLSAFASNGRLEQAKNAFETMQERNVISWTAVLGAYVENGWCMEEARRIFDRMPQRNVVTWNTMVSAYSHCGPSELAKDFFNKMPEREALSWNSMVLAYAQFGHLEGARCLLNRMPKWDVVSWNVVIVAYAQNGCFDKAVETFSQAPQRNAVTWTTMIAVHAQVGRLDEARLVFKLMPQRQVVSWSAMVSGLAQNRQVREARELFKTMPHRDVVAWNVMLAAYAQNGYVGEATDLFFETMPVRDVVSWNVVIAALARTGRGAEALELFTMMNLDGGARPDVISFTGILASCSHIGLVETSRSHFASIWTDFGLMPTVEHYCSMVDVLGRSAQLDDAEELAETMPFLPGDVAWGILLAASIVNRDADRAEKYAQKVVELDPGCGSSYVLLANVFRDAGTEAAKNHLTREWKWSTLV